MGARGDDDVTSRTRPTRAGKKAVAAATRTPGGTKVLVLKVTLRGSKPPIWRRLEVPSSITLDELHAVIQAAFGWENYHMHVFVTADGRQYGDPDPELDFRSEYGLRLTRVAPVGHKLWYTYDFGDDWEHIVEVEKSLPAEPTATYPRCVGGRRAAPPEDCGGIWAFQQLLECRAGAADDGDDDEGEDEDEMSMLPKRFDPSVFDRDEVDTVLAGLAGRNSRDR
jgi:hypothetical protein